MFKFSSRSEANLKTVHADLQKVMRLALRISPVDFSITEGIRTKDRQKKLVESGASQTMNSRHLTGHAVDVAAFIGSAVSWDFKYYEQIASVVKEAASLLGVCLVWGGDWKSLVDGPHFELCRNSYP